LRDLNFLKSMLESAPFGPHRAHHGRYWGLLQIHVQRSIRSDWCSVILSSGITPCSDDESWSLNQMAPRRCDRWHVATRRFGTKSPATICSCSCGSAKYPWALFLKGEGEGDGGTASSFAVPEATTRVAFRLRSWAEPAAMELGACKLLQCVRASCVVSCVRPGARGSLLVVH
jgi:hypothetical protein